MTRAIIIGANSSIAQSIIEQLLSDRVVEQVIAISRNTNPVLESKFGSSLQWICCDNSEESIKGTCSQIGTSNKDFSHVFICNGVLHTEQIAPEKRFEDINTEKLQAILYTNTIVPMLWLANIAPLLRSKIDCSVAVFSARVGSIEDNRFGGWYAYRASKSALNMLVKTASIELRRRAPNVKLLAFHPGTTDTQLSKPFQENVPKGKLFTPEFVAISLLENMKNLDREGYAEFLDWAGEPIPW
jgi:NAD(P)-dependent dehydrogenase (short-subunit alcohol dehydrogenase family)